MISTGSSSSRLLSLPQELRDLIFTYALVETLSRPEHFIAYSRFYQRLSLPASAVQGQDRYQYYCPIEAPKPTWFNLLLACKTTNRDVKNLRLSPSRESTGLDLSVTSTTATASITSLPSNPSTIEDLRINIHLAHIWDQEIQSSDPAKDNKILRSLFSVLRRYIVYGPHLSRYSPLPTPLRLKNVILDVHPAFTAEEASYFFGNPTQQMGHVCGVLMAWLARLAKSGLLEGKVDRLKWRNEWVTGEAVELQYAVTCDIWDEAEVVMFKDLAYVW